MDLRYVQALKNLENLSKIKQREVYCPMANARAITTPLLVTDDLALRTTISSADLYDLELTKLIHVHTSFPDIPEQMALEQFISNMSYIDRQLLLWGIFYSTYETLGKMKIRCPHCGNVFEDEVTAEHILQEDSVTVWDQEIPFSEFIFPIEIPVGIPGIHKIIFNVSIPTIKQHLDVLRLIPPEKLRDNFEKFGSILSKSEELTSVTREIKVFKAENDEVPDSFTFTRDIHVVISEYLTIDIADKVLDAYNEQFTKYVPVFKKPYVCVQCNKDFDYIVDIEVSLFRQFLRR